LRTKKTIGLGKQRDRLYYLVTLASEKPTHQPPSAATISCHLPSSQVASSTALWHRHLGHLSSSRLDFMAKHLLNFPFQSNNVCDVCALAKQSRLPFSVSSISYVRPFELIHCDIWGPYKIASFSGAKYFLTIVDDYSRFTWVFFMHHKSETQHLLVNFFSFVQTQFHVSIANTWVDNGGKFFSMRNFFKQKGINYQHSCVYIPQQYGVVERKHRHILESARAFRFQAHLPLCFWAECVSTAVHVINHLPTPLLSHKTPFEKLFGKLLSYSHLAYATVVHVPHKFAPRAQRCVFLGYPIGQKAYKLYDLTTHKMFTSRDVVFHETIFPYESIPSTSTPVIPLSVSDTYQQPDPSPPVPSISPPDPISSQSPLVAPPPEPLLRRSHRPHHPPTALRDYVCNQVTSPNQLSTLSSSPQQGTRYPLCHYVSYHRYSPQHYSFTAALSQDVEPTSYTEAASHSHWQDAMQYELATLKANNTWSLTSLPPGKMMSAKKCIFGPLNLH
jgi:transposase InsO family protein